VARDKTMINNVGGTVSIYSINPIATRMVCGILFFIWLVLGM